MGRDYSPLTTLLQQLNHLAGVKADRLRVIKPAVTLCKLLSRNHLCQYFSSTHS